MPIIARFLRTLAPRPCCSPRRWRRRMPRRTQDAILDDHEARDALHGRAGRRPTAAMSGPICPTCRAAGARSRPSRRMIWVQPPGTATMGHLFLDAYHATGDDYYYRAAEQAADALIRGQHRSGGWNYFIDFGGAGLDAATGTTRSAATPGGWRNSSIMATMPPSTMPARRRRCSSCCGSIVEKHDPQLPAAARPGDRLRPGQPVSDRRLAAALSATIQPSRQPDYTALHHLQRRRRRREYPLPAAWSTRRSATTRVLRRDHAGDEHLPGHPAGRAAAGLGPAVHARPASRPARAPTSRARSPPTPPRPTSRS